MLLAQFDDCVVTMGDGVHTALARRQVSRGVAQKRVQRRPRGGDSKGKAVWSKRGGVSRSIAQNSSTVRAGAAVDDCRRQTELRRLDADVDDFGGEAAKEVCRSSEATRAQFCLLAAQQ